MASETKALKPCPVCNSMSHEATNRRCCGHNWTVWCPNCEAAQYGATYDEACANWNRRPWEESGEETGDAVLAFCRVIAQGAPMAIPYLNEETVSVAITAALEASRTPPPADALSDAHRSWDALIERITPEEWEHHALMCGSPSVAHFKRETHRVWRAALAREGE